MHAAPFSATGSFSTSSYGDVFRLEESGTNTTIFFTEQDEEINISDMTSKYGPILTVYYNEELGILTPAEAKSLK
jgi:hypothetical protein